MVSFLVLFKNFFFQIQETDEYLNDAMELMMHILSDERHEIKCMWFSQAVSKPHHV